MASNKPLIVYVSGNNGSGKTTLGNALARELGWQHLPAQRFDTSYLDDLFAKQKRWAFEAQSHFLLFKAGLVKNAVANKMNAIVDRSPYEDAQIFARYFYETGRMDKRSYKTYQDLYRHLLEDLPEPDAIVFCRCSEPTLQLRVSCRGRKYEELYPKRHLKILNIYYEGWLERTHRLMPGRLLEVDTELFNFATDAGASGGAASDLLFLLDERQRQPRLFYDPPETTELLPLIPPLPGARGYSGILRRFTSAGVEPKQHFRRKPQVYIAAPFTGRSGPPPTTPSMSPPDSFDFAQTERPHGKISDAAYREFLEQIEAVVRSSGFDTVLPHRDVNAWGDCVLTSEEAANECTKHVLGSDVLIALPATSSGAHYEVGVAVGYGIPVVILKSETEETSFIANGMRAISGVSEIMFGSLTELKQRLPLILNEVASKLRA